MKRGMVVVLVLAVLLVGCVPVEEEEKGNSSVIITSGGEVVSAYQNGDDVTEERKALEEQTEEVVSRFLNRDRGELEFDMFCMLGNEGMTVEVMVDEVSYTFNCGITGWGDCWCGEDGRGEV